MSTTMALFRAELLKARTVRLTYWLGVATIVGVAAEVISSILQLRHHGDLATHHGAVNILTSAGQGAVLILILGILAVAGEFRHGTIIPTTLSADRRNVLASKLAAVSVIATTYAALASATTLAITAVWFRVQHVDATAVWQEAPLVLLGVFLAIVLFGVLGVAVGALIRNQTLAIVVTLVWLLLGENLLISFAPDVARWLPAGAASGLMRSTLDKGSFLPMASAGALLVGYAAAFSVAGLISLRTRDVT
jgi:ABC-2 type transport system permease protein